MRTIRLGLGAWSLVATTSLSAQMMIPPGPPAIRMEDLTSLAVLGVAAALVSPVDQKVAKTVRRSEWVRTGFGHNASTAVSFVGGSAPFAIAGVTWAFGELKDDRNVHDMGRTTTHALLASSLITGALKFTLGRARPYVSADSNSRDLKFWRGWSNDDYRSLPSGHSTMAFAFAAAMSHERARNHGRSGAFDAAVYGSATLVALSRVALDKHWASDILLGAGIGITSGIVTYRFAH